MNQRLRTLQRLAALHVIYCLLALLNHAQVGTRSLFLILKVVILTSVLKRRIHVLEQALIVLEKDNTLILVRILMSFFIHDLGNIMRGRVLVKLAELSIGSFVPSPKLAQDNIAGLALLHELFRIVGKRLLLVAVFHCPYL